MGVVMPEQPTMGAGIPVTPTAQPVSGQVAKIPCRDHCGLLRHHG